MSDSSKGDADQNSAPDRPSIPLHGRLLGIDFGTRRVGFAVSDEEQRLAVPLETYTRSNREQDARHLKAVIADYRVRALVIGLPLHMGGEEGIKAREARQFGAWAAGVSGLPFDFWDERLTTSLADEHLAAANINHKKRKLLRDKIAAQIMLQSYLDSRAARLRDSRSAELRDSRATERRDRASEPSPHSDGERAG